MAICRARVPNTLALSYLQAKSYLTNLETLIVDKFSYFVIYFVVILLFFGTPPPACPGTTNSM